MSVRDGQLSLPGVPPAIQKRSRNPKPTHIPTKADAQALREFVENRTCEPGSTPPMNFEQLSKTAAKLTYTAEERSALLALADKWEKT